jgi:glycosyltransferase involved in cell wall biosynthesis
MSFSISSVDKKFVIIIPSFNNEKWCIKNLESVFNQVYDNYKVIYIDDCSADKTSKKVADYINNLDEKKRSKITLIKNEKRMYAMENRYKAIHMCDPEDIIINLDGDDWFAHTTVLSYLNSVYKDNNIWMTYGRYKSYPNGTINGVEIPEKVLLNKRARQLGKIPTVLYSFYAKLFHLIKKEDLMYKGKFLEMAHSAYMYPIVEMASQHTLFTKNVMYIYNRANPINDSKVDKKKQMFLSQLVANMKPYSSIKSLDF